MARRRCEDVGSSPKKMMMLFKFNLMAAAFSCRDREGIIRGSVGLCGGGKLYLVVKCNCDNSVKICGADFTTSTVDDYWNGKVALMFGSYIVDGTRVISDGYKYQINKELLSRSLKFIINEAQKKCRHRNFYHPREFNSI